MISPKVRIRMNTKQDDCSIPNNRKTSSDRKSTAKFQKFQVNNKLLAHRRRKNYQSELMRRYKRKLALIAEIRINGTRKKTEKQNYSDSLKTFRQMSENRKDNYSKQESSQSLTMVVKREHQKIPHLKCSNQGYVQPPSEFLTLAHQKRPGMTIEYVMTLDDKRPLSPPVFQCISHEGNITEIGKYSCLPVFDVDDGLAKALQETRKCANPLNPWDNRQDPNEQLYDTRVTKELPPPALIYSYRAAGHIGTELRDIEAKVIAATNQVITLITIDNGYLAWIDRSTKLLKKDDIKFDSLENPSLKRFFPLGSTHVIDMRLIHGICGQVTRYRKPLDRDTFGIQMGKITDYDRQSQTLTIIPTTHKSMGVLTCTLPPFTMPQDVMNRTILMLIDMVNEAPYISTFATLKERSPVVRKVRIFITRPTAKLAQNNSFVHAVALNPDFTPNLHEPQPVTIQLSLTQLAAITKGTREEAKLKTLLEAHSQELCELVKEAQEKFDQFTVVTDLYRKDDQTQNQESAFIDSYWTIGDRIYQSLSPITDILPETWTENQRRNFVRKQILNLDIGLDNGTYSNLSDYESYHDTDKMYNAEAMVSLLNSVPVSAHADLLQAMTVEAIRNNRPLSRAPTENIRLTQDTQRKEPPFGKPPLYTPKHGKIPKKIAYL
jgi:hypothetical protein